MEMVILDALIAVSSVFVAIVEVLIALRFMSNCEPWLRTGMFACGFVIGGNAILFFVLKMLVAFRYCSPPMAIIQFATLASIVENVVFGIILYRFSSLKNTDRYEGRSGNPRIGPIPTPVN